MDLPSLPYIQSHELDFQKHINVMLYAALDMCCSKQFYVLQYSKSLYSLGKEKVLSPKYLHVLPAQGILPKGSYQCSAHQQKFQVQKLANKANLLHHLMKFITKVYKQEFDLVYVKPVRALHRIHDS